MKRAFAAVLWLSSWMPLGSQVTYDRLLHPEREPQNWLTYAGSYRSWRYSALDQIRAGNAGNLELKWVYQLDSMDKFEATPLVVDGVMYFSQPPSDVIAVDARTGRAFWTYRYTLSGSVGVCCGRDNRGLAILGDPLFLAALDGNLVAIDAKIGNQPGYAAGGRALGLPVRVQGFGGHVQHAGVQLFQAGQGTHRAHAGRWDDRRSDYSGLRARLRTRHLSRPPERIRLDRGLRERGSGSGGNLAVQPEVPEANAVGRNRRHGNRRPGAGQVQRSDRQGSRKIGVAGII